MLKINTSKKKKKMSATRHKELDIDRVQLLRIFLCRCRALMRSAAYGEV